MDKYFMRFFETEEEYKQAKPNLQYKTLSAIKETKNVYYNVDIHNPYAVVINGGEEVHIFKDGIIPNSYFQGRTDISNVEIRSGINEIGAQAFYGCSYLETIIIRGNLNAVGRLFISTSITIDYYGTTCVNGSFGKANPTINVTKDYECDRFCTKTINIVL